jgi:Uma2 family endonuclease
LSPTVKIVGWIYGFHVMTNAVALPEPLVDDDRGFPLFSVRLSEPVETIIANNPELKVEQTADGEMVFMSPTGGESGLRNSDINADLVIWARGYGGIVFDSSTLFRLPNGALRSPDASWIQAARWQSLSDSDRRSFPPIAPDFVIELRSQTDRVIDLQEKMKEYASCGVRLGWLIDPLLKQVHVYRSTETPVVLREPHCVSDETVLPGFVLDLSRIFA